MIKCNNDDEGVEGVEVHDKDSTEGKEGRSDKDPEGEDKTRQREGNKTSERK